MISDALLSAVLQVAVFTLIPLIVYLVTRRKATGFLEYVGLFKPEARTMALATAWVALTIAALAALLAFAPALRDTLGGPGTAAGALREIGPTPAGIVALLVGALIKTALSEEILFRGFIAKRLIAWRGFAPGNVLHAVLFALPHLLLLVVPDGPRVTAAGATALFTWPFLTALVLAWLNERRGNGSIAPSWWAHAAGNATAYALLAYG